MKYGCKKLKMSFLHPILLCHIFNGNKMNQGIVQCKDMVISFAVDEFDMAINSYHSPCDFKAKMV